MLTMSVCLLVAVSACFTLVGWYVLCVAFCALERGRLAVLMFITALAAASIFEVCSGGYRIIKHRAEPTVQPKDVSTEDIQLMALAVIEEVVKRDAVIRDAEKALKRCLAEQQELAEFRTGQKACKCEGQRDVTQEQVERMLEVKNK